MVAARERGKANVSGVRRCVRPPLIYACVVELDGFGSNWARARAFFSSVASGSLPCSLKVVIDRTLFSPTSNNFGESMVL